jgi:hypothetical protein
LTDADVGQGAEGTRSFYDGQKSDMKVGLEKQPRKELRDQPRTDKIEARHQDHNLPSTFEGLEQNFREDIVLLSKELHDAEDAENTRHREVCLKYFASFCLVLPTCQEYTNWTSRSFFFPEINHRYVLLLTGSPYPYHERTYSICFLPFDFPLLVNCSLLGNNRTGECWKQIVLCC